MILAMYNGVLMTLGVLLLPVFFLIILSRKKYQGRTLERLGLNIGTRASDSVEPAGAAKKPVIWIHALSVGEVTSALPLVKALRTAMAEAVLVVTVGTSSGKTTAENLLSPYVQSILSGPFDLRFSVRRYIRLICPDLFIQVETDFWPNRLFLLRRHGIPTMLVNGRISEKSFTAYRRFAFFSPHVLLL
ncbi:MAG: hypothetical protein D3904_18340 [Candidatus Electrothrix sp. EH2]|nr:hypothetical protein [Candidatus Electrothrix sp. EH2]